MGGGGHLPLATGLHDLVYGTTSFKEEKNISSNICAMTFDIPHGTKYTLIQCNCIDDGALLEVIGDHGNNKLKF